jgi:hypothetical protein
MRFQDAEAETLRKLLGDRSKKSFAESIKLPGGASMLSQHLSGNRPISLEAGICYAAGFGIHLRELSPRLADLAKSASAAVSTEVDPILQYLMTELDSSEPVTLDQIRVLVGDKSSPSKVRESDQPTRREIVARFVDSMIEMPAARYASFRAQLDQVIQRPEMRDDVIAELEHLLDSPPRKQLVNGGP